MRVAIFGGTGMLGFAVAKALKLNGFYVDIISRTPEKYLKNKQYQGFNIIKKLNNSTNYDVCINLGGLSIFRRWNSANKQKFLHSRVCFFDKITDYSLESGNEFKLIINGSAIGFYPSGNDVVDEYSEIEHNNNLFSQQLCLDVERESLTLQKPANQLINIRTGVVLANEGGFLKRLLPSFKFGFGSIIGDGQQFMSWIDLSDFCRAVLFIIANKDKFQELDVINLTSPNFITNEEFSKELAKALNKPCLLKIPKFVVKNLFGQMGVELMLGSQKVYPKKLTDAGFKFERGALGESIKSHI